MSLKLDGYIRVSRVGGGGKGYISPRSSGRRSRSYAGELGGEIVAWHQDEDYSGGNTERPDFQAVLERLRAGETDGIVVMEVDRFARSVADGAAIVREIIDADQVFASCHERIDPRTAEGKYMLNTLPRQRRALPRTRRRRAGGRRRRGPLPVASTSVRRRSGTAHRRKSMAA